MTPERARYLIANQLIGGDLRRAFPPGRVYDDGMTREEYDSLVSRWLASPGWSTLYGTLCEIARGA